MGHSFFGLLEFHRNLTGGMLYCLGHTLVLLQPPPAKPPEDPDGRTYDPK